MRKRRQTKADGDATSATEVSPERKSLAVYLEPGFYIVDNNGVIRTREVTKGKPGSPERKTVIEPIRLRTIGGAKDVLACSSGNLAILCVTQAEFTWGD